MDTLVKALRARRHSIQDGSWTFIGQQYYLDLREVRARPVDGGYKNVPPGNFCLRIGVRYAEREWHDAKEVKLEDKLSRIIAHLEISLEDEKEFRIRNKQFQEEWNRKREQDR